MKIPNIVKNLLIEVSKLFSECEVTATFCSQDCDD